MRFTCLAVCLLVACTPELPTGVTIEIAPMDGVATVELFVGDRVGTGMSGSPGGVAEPAELFEVAPNDGPWTITPSDGEAFLLLNDTDTEFKIHMLAAVGYDANGTAIAAYRQRDVYIQPGMTERWRLELSPASAIVPDEDAADGEFRVVAWTRVREPTTPSCVQIEHGRELYALGPQGDFDCDELMPVAGEECAPWVHLAQGVAPMAGFASAVCGAKVSIDPAFPVACLAGGRSCNEVTMTADTTCIPLAGEFCVSADLCNCTDWDQSCLMRLQLPPVTSYIECSVCSDRAEFIDLELHSILGASPATCTDVRIHELSPLGGLGSVANFGNGRSLTVTGSTDCKVDLEYNGPVGLDTDIAVVSLDLDSTATNNHVVVPLYVYYEASCNGIVQACTVHASEADPARLCATPPPVTLCGGDAICNGGPWCAGTCCNQGERCESGVCLCGNLMGGCEPGAECQAGPAIGNCGSQCCGGNTGVQCDF